MALSSVVSWIIIVTCLAVSCRGDDDGDVELSFLTNEHRLYDYLLQETRYNKYVRPAAHENDTIVVEFGLSLVSMEDLDEENQVLSMHAWQRMSWTDVQLKWEPDQYGGVKTLQVPASKLWVPDIVPYNAAQSSYQVSYDGLAVVDSAGKVIWMPVIHLKTSCPLDMHRFPYDRQLCTIKYGSWTHSENRINLTHFGGSELPELGHYAENLEWELTGMTGKMSVTRYPGYGGYPDITYKLSLRRRPGYLNHVFVAPAVVLAFLVPVLFVLPPESGEKITMGTGLMVTLVLLMMMLENFIPTSHPRVPVIGLYYLVCMVMVGFSMGSSALIINVWYKSRRQKQIPAPIRVIFLSVLSKLLCVSKEEFSVSGSYQPVSMRRLELVGNGEETFTSDGNLAHNDSLSRAGGDSAAGAEWRQLAVVLDRLCFVVFFVVMFFITVSMAH